MKKYKNSIFLSIILCVGVYGSANGVKSLPNPMKELFDDSFWQKYYIGELNYIINKAPKISVEERDLIQQIQALLPDGITSAINILEVSINSESSPAMILILGNLYIQNDNFEQAKIYIDRVARQHPYYLIPQKALAYLNVRNEKYDEAIPYLVRTINMGNTEGRTYGLLGYCYQLQDKAHAAEQAYTKAVIIEPTEKQWRTGLAHSLLSQDKYLESNALFQEMLLKDPDNEDHWLLQFNGFIGLNQIEDAAANIEILKRMNKAPPDSLLLLGDIYINKQMLKLAQQAYLASIDKDHEQDINGPIRAASSLTNFGAYDEAAILINKIRRVYRGRTPDEEELTLLTMQSQIAIARGEGEKAKATLEKIIERDDKRGRALITLANYYGQEDNIEGAVDMFEKAQKLDDFKAEALVAHAQLLTKIKDWDKAAELLTEAQEVDFKENVQDFLEQVERIQMITAATSEI